MNKHAKIILPLALLLIAFAGLRLYRIWTQPPQTEAIQAYYDAVAEQARRVAIHLENDARVVVLVFDAEWRSANNQPIKRMVQTLKQEGITLLHLEKLVMDVDKGWSAGIPGFPYEEYVRVARAHANADAVISFCGTPYLADGTERPDPAGLVPLVLGRAEQWTSRIKELLQEGRATYALVIREEQDDAQSPDGASDFDRKFEVLTAAP